MKDLGEKSSKREIFLRDGIVDLFKMEYFKYINEDLEVNRE